MITTGSAGICGSTAVSCARALSLPASSPPLPALGRAPTLHGAASSSASDLRARRRSRRGRRGRARRRNDGTQGRNEADHAAEDGGAVVEALVDGAVSARGNWLIVCLRRNPGQCEQERA